MGTGRILSRLLIVSLVAALCTLGAPQGIDPIQNPSGSVGTPPTGSTTTTTTPSCQSKQIAAATLIDTEPASLAVAISRTGFDCAEAVVVASGEVATLMAGAQLAAAAGGPLLVDAAESAPVAEEIERLNPALVYFVGTAGGELPAGVESRTVNVSEALIEASGLIGGAPIIQATGPRAVARAVVGTVNKSGVITGVFQPDLETDGDWVAAHAPARATVWLADGNRPDLVAPVLAAAGSRGETVLLGDPGDLRTQDANVRTLRTLDPHHIVVAGGFAADRVEWQLAALIAAPELPGGGLVFSPERRLVALYGNPTTSALGVLGEQSAEESVGRVMEVAAGYDADGASILPSFEIIATVASAFAGDDNDYSQEMTLETLRPWIEVAGHNGVYVILDLQPGRTDFLTQARRYEEFLRLPHVGLALDSEWRLKPDQVHLRQIGSVDAAEINTVVEWLAALVREHNLPQKYLLLHQFRLDMITNRDQVKTPPELAVVIQMDG